jgi:rubredoxin
VRRVTCESCGQLYVPTKPQSALAALLSERKPFDVAPELRATAACPNCGHVQSSAQYEFFGFLSARGMQIVIALILVAMLALGLAFRD